MIVGWVAKSAFQRENDDEAVDLGVQYVPTHPFLCRHGHPSQNGSGGYVAQGTGGRNATVQHGTIGGIPHFQKQPCAMNNSPVPWSGRRASTHTSCWFLTPGDLCKIDPERWVASDNQTWQWKIHHFVRWFSQLWTSPGVVREGSYTVQDGRNLGIYRKSLERSRSFGQI